MKTIEQKAKAYDEAVKRAINVSDFEWSSPQALSEYIFPELAESEEEKVRKELLLDIPKVFPHDKAIRYIAYLEKQGEQKQADEPNGEDYGIDGLYAAVDILQKTLGKVDGYQTDDGILEHECAISAVKKLYGQKSTWSEDDEKIFKSILEELKSHIGVTRDEYCKYFYWLKSLRPQATWRPSDEQMDALNYYATTLAYHSEMQKDLRSLWEDLKKLTE